VQRSKHRLLRAFGTLLVRLSACNIDPGRGYRIPHARIAAAPVNRPVGSESAGERQRLKRYAAAEMRMRLAISTQGAR